MEMFDRVVVSADQKTRLPSSYRGGDRRERPIVEIGILSSSTFYRANEALIRSNSRNVETDLSQCNGDSGRCRPNMGCYDQNFHGVCRLRLVFSSCSGLVGGGC